MKKLNAKNRGNWLRRQSLRDGTFRALGVELMTGRQSHLRSEAAGGAQVGVSHEGGKRAPTPSSQVCAAAFNPFEP
jgi:hypothetical protein